MSGSRLGRRNDSLACSRAFHTHFILDKAVIHSFSSYYFAIARNRVAQGGNVAIVDSINAKVKLQDDVVWRPFQPRIDSKIAMITSREQPLGQAASALAELLQNRLGDVVNNLN